METLRETAAIQAESRRTISRLRAVGTCSHPCPIDITTLADPAPTALCTGCGQRMSIDEAGRWVITEGAPLTEGDQTPGG
jgi:hypothetical protein